jgi:hypothetical protein
MSRMLAGGALTAQASIAVSAPGLDVQVQIQPSDLANRDNAPRASLDGRGLGPVGAARTAPDLTLAALIKP